jgi:transcriptional regulator with XRE-family HTH domain
VDRNVRFDSNGNVVRDARLDRGWTREQLAVLAGCSLSLIARFESEPGYTPQAPALLRICRLLDVDVEDVLGEEALACAEDEGVLGVLS